MGTNYTKMIHIADVHFYNVNRHTEYREILSQFISEIRDIEEKTTDGEVGVLIAGDFFHQKITISNELNIIANWFLREISSICDVFIYAGNHDFIVGNKQRIDTLKGVLTLMNVPNIYYIDELLDYKSGVFNHGNISFCLYSIFDELNKPDMTNIPDNNIRIGCFHETVTGSETDAGYNETKGYDLSLFEGCDVVMAGHIHKRQELNHRGIKVVYSGSVIQQNFGENISGHGYLIWDLDELEYEAYDLENPYAFYKLEISSIEELEQGLERLVNR